MLDEKLEQAFTAGDDAWSDCDYDFFTYDDVDFEVLSRWAEVYDLLREIDGLNRNRTN